MPVFISYQRVDQQQAKRIQERLAGMGIETYIDVMDPVLQSSEHVTGVILRALDTCTHLLAVVSESTARSWWVPFEIGVATKGDRRIASFRRDSVALPDFLTIWPVLDSESQLGRYGLRYYEDAIHRQTGQVGTKEIFKSIRTANQFHARLKEDLGQS